MKKTWIIWGLIVGVIIAVLIVFNYDAHKNKTPISKILPGEETQSEDFEYEFMDSTAETTSVGAVTTDAQEQVKTMTSMMDADSEDKKISAPSIEVAAQIPSAKSTTLTKPSVVTSQNATIARTSSAPSSMTPSSSSGQYTIQISSFNDKSKADLFLSKVRQKEADAYIFTRDLKEKGIWYRVCVGQFTNKPEANNYWERIKEEFKGSFVISLKKQP